MKVQVKYLIAATLFVGIGFIGLDAEAQRNNNRHEHQKAYKYEQKKSTKQQKRSGERYATTVNDRSQRQYQGRNYSDQRNYKQQNHKKSHQSQMRHDYRYDSHKSHYNNHYNERYRYNHPQYGQVYRQFHGAPVRLHHAHGNFYWHSGYYYQYHPHVGYVRCAPPRNYVFTQLPGNCVHVHHGGLVYYRVGDIYFERCYGGYRISPHFNVQLSFHM